MAEYCTKSSMMADKANNLKRAGEFLMTQTIEKLKEIITDFENIASALDLIASRINGKSTREFDRFCNEAWTYVGRSVIGKKIWSESDFKNWLKNNRTGGKIKELADKFSSSLRMLKELKKYIDKIVPIVEVVKSIKVIHSEKYHLMNINSEKLDSCSKLRMETKSAVRQFEAVMDIIKVISNLLPRGFQDYISLNIAVFESSKKLFNLADDYATVVTTLASENENIWNKILNNINCWISATNSLKIDMDVDRYLDNFQKKLEQEQRKYENNRNEYRRQH